MIERKKYRQRWKPGSILQIDLDDGSFAYGQVLNSPDVAFYDYKTYSDNIHDIHAIKEAAFIFKIGVMKYCVTQDWKIIDQIEVNPKISKQDDLFIYDRTTKKCEIWRGTGERVSATWEECQNIEALAIWDSHSVEQRLRDYFAGRPCFDVESMKPGWIFIPVTEFYKQYGYEYLSEEERLTGKKSSS